MYLATERSVAMTAVAEEEEAVLMTRALSVGEEEAEEEEAGTRVMTPPTSRDAMLLLGNALMTQLGLEEGTGPAAAAAAAAEELAVVPLPLKVDIEADSCELEVMTSEEVIAWGRHVGVSTLISTPTSMSTCWPLPTALLL
jgi:hypothetical protein